MDFYFRRLKNVLHLVNAVLANVFYSFPGKDIKIIGVTGTDGKTTTSHMIYTVLRDAGKKVSLVSTIYAKVGGKDFDTGFHVTTPNPWKLQMLIRQAVAHGDEFIVLEITSHALDQNRVWGLYPIVGVVTNVTNEHLDYHKTYESYLNTKLTLLDRSSICVINAEDSSYRYISRQKSRFHSKKIVTFGVRSGDATQKSTAIHVGMEGVYNLANALAAYAAVREVGIAKKTIQTSLAHFRGIPGRLDVVFDSSYTVIIDFAHTANGLLSVLKAVRKKAQKKLILVFGCAGARDRAKRPIMGAYASMYADIIILTEEDYRLESVEKIMNEIESGMKISKNDRKRSFSVYKIPDRQEAINDAIGRARKGDVVLLTGKGHERSLCRGDREYPWSEHEAVKKALLAARGT